MENKTVEKVIEFTQSETKTKTFRLNHPVSDELKDVMVSEVISDFMKYAWGQYYAESSPLLKEYVDEHDPKNEKRQGLVSNLFWWKIFYDCSKNSRVNCVEDYIAENYHLLSKRPLLISWLKECAKAVPKFYHVGYKYNDRVLIVTDILEEETLDVMVYDSLAISPRKGEIVMGTLIPLGGGLYFPIIDFYHFDFEARKEIAMHIHYYYEQHLKTSSMHEAFIHVLSAMLQIERFVFIDNQKNTSK